MVTLSCLMTDSQRGQYEEIAGRVLAGGEGGLVRDAEEGEPRGECCAASNGATEHPV
jgi:hypothetical protein